VQFRVLGPVEIETDRGQVVTPSRRQHRLLLAVLLLEVGRVVPAHRLADLLWEDDPPEQARRAIYSHVARVRAILADAGADASGIALISHGDGYQINVQPDAVDVHRFRSLVEEAGKSVDLPHRDKLLRDALALWHGPALHNAASDRLRARICADLDELHLHAIEESMATGLALGRHRELIPELARLTTDHPLRSRLTRLHMLALHHTGRTTDALDVYTAARTTLAEELGLDPDPALRRLHEAILRGEPVPTSDLTAPTPDTAATPPAQLPADIAVFTGRDLQLKTLDELLDTQHHGTPTAVVISAIAGTAGVGKTALAVHWAHRVRDRFPDGQLYFNLRGFDPGGTVMEPGDAIRQLLDALNVPAQRIPADLDAQVNLYRTLLADKNMLVVIDNVRDPDQVRPLLPGGPGCLVLITSRNELTSLVAAEGAHSLALDLLTTDEARDLLSRRLGIRRTEAEPDAVDAIITSCARLPLALAIVAARIDTTKTLSLTALADQLRNSYDRLDALSTGDAPTTDMRAVFSWSYNALTPDAARLFRLLGLYPGPDISAAAAASLTGFPSSHLRRPMAELAHAHLIIEHSPGRYTLHDLLRAYAAEQAHRTDSDDERRTAVHRLLDHYLHTAHAAAELIPPPRRPIALAPPQPAVSPEAPADHEQALAWFTAERRVLLSAIEHAAIVGLDAHAWQLAWALMYFLDRRGHWHDQLAAQHAAIAAARRLADPSAQAKASRVLARTYIRVGRLEDARTHLRHALDFDIDAADQIGQAHTHQGLAMVCNKQGRYVEALAHAHQALNGFQTTGHRLGQAMALDTIGCNHARLGDHRQTLTFCQHALTLFEELDDPYGQAAASNSLGYAHHHLNNHAQAIACYQHALALFWDLRDRYQQADVMTRLGDTHHAAGDPDAARHAWRDALTILEQLDHAAADTVRTKLHDLNHSHPQDRT
jgi:DNA-binding SARP family transcriptional activator